MTDTPAPAPAAPTPPATAAQIFSLFFRIGFTSFGGGTSAWMYREVVLVRRWLDEEEFFNIMAVCQALPGMNVTNIATWIGRRLLGPRGALIALSGLVVIPSIMIVLIAIAFASIAKFPLTAIAMSGATAAAIALPAVMGLSLAKRVRRTLVPLAVTIGTFVAVGVLRVPLVWVVTTACAVSLGYEFLRKEQ
jgi:chromate transporter